MHCNEARGHQTSDSGRCTHIHCCYGDNDETNLARNCWQRSFGGSFNSSRRSTVSAIIAVLHCMCVCVCACVCVYMCAVVCVHIRRQHGINRQFLSPNTPTARNKHAHLLVIQPCFKDGLQLSHNGSTILLNAME